MSCSVCAGHSDYSCPCCGEDHWVTCPDCGGDGMAYYASVVGQSDARVRITKTAYMIIPFDEDDAKAQKQRYYQGDVDTCPRCHGEGYIENINH